jgi:hypothetical protein
MDGLAVRPPCRREAPAEVDEGLFRHVMWKGRMDASSAARLGGVLGRRTMLCGVLREHGSRRCETRGGRKEHVCGAEVKHALDAWEAIR